MKKISIAAAKQSKNFFEQKLTIGLGQTLRLGPYSDEGRICHRFDLRFSFL